MLTTWPASCGVCIPWPVVRRYFTFQHSRGCWQVSSLGRLCDTKGVVSFGSPHASGYKAIKICKQMWRVHRVVKITFHGLPQTGEAWQVNHVDGDRSNNRLDNLEYVSRGENIRHSYSSLSRCSSGPAQSKTVLSRPVGSANWTTHPSITAAARQLGMSTESVSRCSRKNSAAKGYEFRLPSLRDMSLPEEEWKQMVHPISGALVPGRMVSSLGRVTSRYGLTSRGHKTLMGYYTTGLTINACYHNMLVHRLVAVAFHGPPPSKDQTFVNHKDLDKGNNAANNLEWVSSAENRAHFLAASTLGRGTRVKPVWSRQQDTNDAWRWHQSFTSAEHELGLCRDSISRCVRGLQRQTCGFEFQLADATETISSLPGEEWRDVDVGLLQRDREIRGFR